MIRSTLAFIPLMVFPACLLFSQKNLVHNPSFEEKYECPEIPDGAIDLAVHWDSPAGNGGSTDYIDTCSDHYKTVSCFSRRSTHTGSAMCLIDLFGREYAEVELKSPLEPGREYVASFYVNRLEFSWATSAIGMHLSKDFLRFPNPPYASVIPVIPQVANPPGNILEDTLGWTRISGRFTAEGGEKYLTIGNFVPSNQMIIVYYGGYSSCIYLIEDVSLFLAEDEPLPAFAGNDTTLCLGDSILLGRPDEGEGSYTWYCGDGKVLGRQAQLWVKPGKDIQLTLEQKDFSFETTFDSVFISVIPCELPPEPETGLEIPNVFTPNGDGRNDLLEVRDPRDLPYRLQVYNRWGKLCFTGGQGESWDGRVNNEPAAEGAYFYTLQTRLPSGKELEYRGVVHLLR